MSNSSYRIAPERPDDEAEIEALHAAAFGPGRFARTAYRLREGVPPLDELSFTAWAGERLVGSIRFSPVCIGDRAGLLLGPLVVHPDWKGKGCGIDLMRTAIARARGDGHAWVLLVGDEPYYARAGFARVPRGLIVFPGPVDPDRILALELVAGSLEGLAGRINGGKKAT